MTRMIHDNGLSLALIAMFLISFVGMVGSGHSAYNQELSEHGSASIGLLAYLHSGAFISAVFENWESEFLQMSAYVVLTAVLFQRGSAESRDPDNPTRDNDELPNDAHRRNRFFAWLYAHSLGLALALLFLVSFVLHWFGSLTAKNDDALRHGGQVHTLLSYLLDSTFWFESFQNWQSEFLSTAVLVVASIFLRHQGSPESKPAGASNAETGASLRRW